MSSRKSWHKPVAALLFVGAVAVGGYAPWRRSQPVDANSPLYKQAVGSFYAGVIAFQTGEHERAIKNLTKVTELVPQEPSGWANLGIAQFNSLDFVAAGRSLGRAQQLAPNNVNIQEAISLMHSRDGKSAEAVKHLRRALEMDASNQQVRYLLAQEIGRLGEIGRDAEMLRLLQQILQVHPNNIVVLLEATRLAAKQRDRKTLSELLSRLRALSAEWPPEARAQLRSVEEAARANPVSAAVQLLWLSNALKPVEAYQASLRVIDPTSNNASGGSSVGQAIERFIRLPQPRSVPAPADTAIMFSAQALPGTTNVDALRTIYLSSEAKPDICTITAGQVHISGNTALTALTLKSPTTGESAPSKHAVLPIDWNWDFLTDLALVGSGGLRLYQQKFALSFVDVTSRMGLPPNIVSHSYYGAWAVDIEADGDLDMVLARRSGAPVVLRNNGDGTWKVLEGVFPSTRNLRSLAWADFDDDGDNDIALLDDTGTLHVFDNERSGQYQRRQGPANVGRVLALSASSDIDSDGMIDIVLLQSDGTVARLTSDPTGAAWSLVEIARADDLIRSFHGATACVITADLDNNGSLDLIASVPEKTQIWLSTPRGRYQPLYAQVNGAVDAYVSSIADLNQDGKLDLVGIAAHGNPVQFHSRSSKNYQWTAVHALADESGRYTGGDGRINTFGLGGSVELRFGLVYSRQVIGEPLVHFGLGDYPAADVMRIIWPNGQAQGEFDLKPGKVVKGHQRLLTGSCPFLWAFDGKGIEFIKDCNWRSPLGLKINAQDTAGVLQTQDWIQIRADQLRARDGFYDLRVTADLWETHFFDHVALLAVDHPVGSSAWVDERFSIPMPPLHVTMTAEPQPVVSARNNNGHHVTQTVSQLDQKYLDNFGRGAYQGVARDHWIEVELPQNVPTDKPLWLICEGWLHPTDSSINVAISQGKHAPPRDLSLEVADGKGGWKVAIPHMGFPAGKNKKILVDLKNVFVPHAPRKLRLRTNLEIFWDKIHWAGAPRDTAATPAKITRLLPRTAQLRYRGISDVQAKNSSSPELPTSYENVTKAQQWRDLIGFYTRFGDVRSLVQRVDDRYVIMNAGDEMLLKFTELPPPPSGWKRDFVFISDGWTKDGNLNTTWSKTVLPLPLHSNPEYSTAPGRLQDDPAYRKNPRDWQTYHTRYVSTRQFRTALRPQSY